MNIVIGEHVRIGENAASSMESAWVGHPRPAPGEAAPNRQQRADRHRGEDFGRRDHRRQRADWRQLRCLASFGPV